MRAFILAAGLGTRLKPLTDTKPKALVKVNGTPLLEHQILRLKNAGITDIVVNVHHFADMIEEFLNRNDNFGCRIRISDERDLLRETGGAIRHASPLLAGSDDRMVLVHNVDIITELDFNSIKKDASATATLVVSERTTNRYLLFDEEMRLRGWTNTATGEVRIPDKSTDPGKLRKYAYSGIQIISTDILPLMAEWPEKFSIIDFYLDICSGKIIRGYNAGTTPIKDVGKIADILE